MDCGSYGKLDFFPEDFENQPAAWTRANQLKAGNTDKYSLYPIVLYGNPWPKLHFLPIHPLLVPGDKPVPEECRQASQWRRRMLGAEWGSVVKPAPFSWTLSLNGGPEAPGFDTMVLTNMTDMPHWTRQIWGLRDGQHTLKITVTIAAGSALLFDGPDGRNVPEKDVTFSQTVTFYKMTERPTLDFNFLSCNPIVTMQATNMWPDPVIAPGGLGALFKPVYHVWGKFVKGLDGQPYSGEDGTNGGDQVHFFDQYWIRQIGSPQQAAVPLSGVKEGWYQIFVEGSLTTDMPSLLSLSGNGTFNDNDTDPNWMYIQPGGTLDQRGVSLRGQPKFNGALVIALNGSKLGVQGANSTLVSFEGPAQSIEVGQYATFTWQYNGLGATTCTIDGRPEVTDPYNGQCMSPLRKKVNDNLRHTLVVTFKDVCGVTRRDVMNFSVAEGWTTNSTADGLPLDDVTAAPLPLRTIGEQTRTPAGNSARGGAAARGLWAAAAAAAALVVALL